MSTTTQTQSILPLRAQIVALDSAIRDMEKAAAPYGKSEKEKATYLADDKNLEAVERARGEEGDALLRLKPNTDAEIAAYSATLLEQTLPFYELYRLDAREQGLVNLNEAIQRRFSAS
jgi:hypothetical protein